MAFSSVIIVENVRNYRQNTQ